MKHPTYKKFTDANYNYHCFTQSTKSGAILAEGIWLIKRETIATGDIVFPLVDNEANRQPIHVAADYASIVFADVT